VTARPHLTTIQALMAEGVPPGGGDDPSARRLWWAALEVVQDALLKQPDDRRGVWLAAPLPALYEPSLLQGMAGWVWTPHPIGWPQLGPAAAPDPAGGRAPIQRLEQLRLQPDDGHDPLLIVISPSLQVALALHGPEHQRQLLLRSDPTSLAAVLERIDQRLQAENPAQATALRDAIQGLGSLQSSRDFATVFWPAVAERLARMAPSLTLQTLPDAPSAQSDASPPAPQAGAAAELSLLEAITHEVRTPLATIRTLIRSLLRRRDLPDLVTDRLRQIDSECTEQIDRFGLIFHAAELHASELQSSERHRQAKDSAGLARTDLGAMLLQLAPAWEQQLERRGLALQLDISPALPAVLSDPGRLEPMLGGLIDRSSRSLQHGGRLVLQLRAAGARLKLQIRGHNPNPDGDGVSAAEPSAELGPVLSWNPGTGSLQLSQGATRRLLASLGGRLTQQRDRGLTVFFPVAGSNQC
jgi:signal transduction histidine kinase